MQKRLVLGNGGRRVYQVKTGMDNIQAKIARLPPEYRREAADFVDFLLEKSRSGQPPETPKDRTFKVRKFNLGGEIQVDRDAIHGERVLR